MPRRAAATGTRAVKGGQTATSTPLNPAAACFNSCTKETASGTVLNIFQFPAMSGLRPSIITPYPLPSSKVPAASLSQPAPPPVTGPENKRMTLRKKCGLEPVLQAQPRLKAGPPRSTQHPPGRPVGSCCAKVNHQAGLTSPEQSPGIVQLHPGRAPSPKRGYLSSSATTPGSSFPSRNSRAAPPPVEIWVSWSATPACFTAATESPPPTTVMPLTWLSSRAMASVPRKGLHFKNTHGPVPEHCPGVFMAAQNGPGSQVQYPGP